MLHSYSICPENRGLMPIALEYRRLWITTVLALTVAGCSGEEPGGPVLGVTPKVCSSHAVNASPSELMGASHDDTNCAGVASATVRVIGADGQQLDLTTNDHGNFFYAGAWPASAFPYKAEVTYNGNTFKMMASRTVAETNCASCHTAIGANGAPGRIVAK
jgi:hypothetical protein